MKLFFYKTTLMNVSAHVKNLTRSSAFLITEIDDEYCLNWSLLAHLQTLEILKLDFQEEYQYIHKLLIYEKRLV